MRHKWLNAAERYLLALELERKYKAGASIRDLVAETGWSYGAIHGRLLDAGVALRPRGGNMRGKSRTRPSASSRATPTSVPVGHAYQSRYALGKPMHAVVDTPDGWRMLCTGGKGTFQYNGSLHAITCERCRNKVEA